MDQVIVSVDNSIANGGPAAAQPTDENDWYPLGVFGLIPPGSDDFVATVELAVTQTFTVRGYQTDIATDDVVDVYGGATSVNSLDANGQPENGQIYEIAWQANGDDSYKFATTLDALLQTESVVNVFDPVDKSVSVWQVVREDPNDVQQAAQQGEVEQDPGDGG